MTRSFEEIQAILDDLPEVTKQPCAECPWRRDATPGHLGPHTAEEWVELAHADGPIACHMTIPGPEAEWSDPEMRQCAGSAIFRANIYKNPRHPNVAVAEERNTEKVFTWDDEFVTHHTKGTTND